MELKNVNRHHVKSIGDRVDSSDDGDDLGPNVRSLDKEDMERMGKTQQFKVGLQEALKIRTINADATIRETFVCRPIWLSSHWRWAHGKSC